MLTILADDDKQLRCLSCIRGTLFLKCRLRPESIVKREDLKGLRQKSIEVDGKNKHASSVRKSAQKSLPLKAACQTAP